MAILEVNELTKDFGATKVLKGITFSLEEGKVLSIIGSSGSGKTTLLRCINGLETATSGKISVNEKIVYDSTITDKKALKELKGNQQNIGLVFQ
ncbi:MAG: amino acid ABC transporter ATP-binding protein, partial [Clostridia bacterium]|nr:amino acid ABC transporter ATP-binding protein [Clostridia bacterium]